MIDLKSYGMQTHQGPHLNLNEDVVEADLINNLFMLIDGFGGSNVGDRAAMLIRDQLKRSFTKIAIDPEATFPFFYSHRYLIEGNALINAFHNAHKAMNRDNEEKTMDNRGGASVIAASIAENILTLVSTGNCVAYLYRKGQLSLEVLPDSLASLSRDSLDSRLQSIPMSGIGLFEDLHYTVRELRVSEGDLIVLLSDGVYSRLVNDEIKNTIERGESELEIIKELFRLSNDRGNLDNQSGIVLQF
ncbi:MAG: SpoIIE family protein phosphatase [Bdellovibrionales bacterium]|nr:SpoIIE family protein phosphatase [Bdellovibrionales bacterium]